MSTARLVTTTLLAGSMAMLPVGVSAAQATPSRPTPPDAVLQWDEIAANTVVKSGAFQNEGLLYMGYVSSAVYDAARSPQDHDRANASGPKADSAAAVVEAAYDTLTNYFPAPRDRLPRPRRPPRPGVGRDPRQSGEDRGHRRRAAGCERRHQPPCW